MDQYPEFVTVRLTPEDKARLETFARQEDRKNADAARRLIQRALKDIDMQKAKAEQ